MKDEFKPYFENEDYLIEDIIQRAYLNERLEFQKHKLEFKGLKIIENKNGDVNVDFYRQMFDKKKKRKKGKK